MILKILNHVILNIATSTVACILLLFKCVSFSFENIFISYVMNNGLKSQKFMQTIPL